MRRLTPTEFRLLWCWPQNSGRAMSRDELQQRVWGVPTARATARSTCACASCARRSTAARDAQLLQTQYGIGYRFGAEPKASVTR